jgi:nucleoside 2-deoxyribosyltransferase
MYLSHTKCYLVGPIEHDSEFGRDWRDAIKPALSNLNVEVYDPLDRPEWFKHIEDFVPPNTSREEILKNINNGCDKSHKAQKFIRALCLRYVNSCDFVLCYLPNRKTYGTTEELVVAKNTGKPIISICPAGIPSLWVYDLVHQGSVFGSLIKVIQHLQDINEGKIDLDLLQWIFLNNKQYPKLKLEDEYVW